MATVAPIETNVQDAINKIQEGSKVELGILKQITAAGLGSFPADVVPAGEIHGDEARIRKNGFLVGANRSSTITNDFYSDNAHLIHKIPLNQEHWLRYTIDIQTYTSLAKTYTGEDLINQFEARLTSGMNVSIAAKFDAVCIDIFNKGLDQDANPDNPETAGVWHVDNEALTSTTTPPDDIFKYFLNLTLKLSDKEKELSTYRLGTDREFKAYCEPLISNITSYHLNFRGIGEYANKISNGVASNIAGINFQKHPFFNQLVNQATTNFNNIDRTITRFDASTTYDFTGLSGVIFHPEAVILPLKFTLFTMNVDPTTGNIIVVARIGYGDPAQSLVRPGLYLKIKDSRGFTNQIAYEDNKKRLANYVSKTANAITVASGSPLNTPLETFLKGLTSTDYPELDLTTTSINSTTPINAETVSEPTKFTAVIEINPASGKKANAVAFTINPFYKNS